MSHNLVPLPGQLLAEKRTSAEAKLECASTVPAVSNPPSEDLYKWADDIWNALTDRRDPNPKLTLAESLDIPQDERWRGSVSAQRNTPRHRVVARFARERLWHQIWSLNWDCVLESAMDNVGIKRNSADGQMPWPTVFKTFVTAAECAGMGEVNTIKILKPHGCVTALVEAQDAKDIGNTTESTTKAGRFLITHTELGNLEPAVANGPEQQFIFATLLTALSSHPLVIAGWSVSEPYLINRIRTDVEPFLQNPGRQTPIAVDELSVIDRQFNLNGHTSLAEFYGKDAASAHIDVGQPGFDTDEFFLWLQALYAVESVKSHALKEDRSALVELALQIEQPPSEPMFTISWVDNFLPVWVRLCWRNGLVPCNDKNSRQISADDIALESRDEHIPWKLPNIRRPELIAASRILAALHRSGHGNRWNYERFPGAFYRDRQLIIPIPTWTGAPSNDLRGLKPLIDTITLTGAGYFTQVALVFVNPDSSSVISDHEKRACKQRVAKYLSTPRFANADKIDELRMEDL